MGLETSGWRQGGNKNWLMPGTWGTCHGDLYWPLRRRQFAWFNQVIVEVPMQDDKYETFPCKYLYSVVTRFRSQGLEVEEFLAVAGTIGSRASFGFLWGSSRSLPTSRAGWILSPKFQRGLSDS